jgi:hypothetical protein
MTTSLEPSALKVSEQDVTAAEERLRIKLPADYRSFVLRTNGGRCKGDARFRHLSLDQELSEVDTFLGISGMSHRSLEQNYSGIADLLPAGVLPIAYDGGGNYLLIDCKAGQTYGWVFFSTLEHLNELDGAIRDDLIPVARNFEDLLRKIDLKL